jgi:hypothetical protein
LISFLEGRDGDAFVVVADSAEGADDLGENEKNVEDDADATVIFELVVAVRP